MDDLLGEDWKASSKSSTTTPLNPTPFASNYTGLTPTPTSSASGVLSPQNASRPSSTVNGTAKSANDSFSNLFAPKAQKQGGELSIQERQKQLVEEKRRQQTQQAQMWDTLGSGRATPEVRGAAPAVPSAQEDEDDILAAFNKAAPVDNASFYPPPAPAGPSGRSTPASAQQAPPIQSAAVGPQGFDPDDDPFGLGSMPKHDRGRDHEAIASSISLGDDDILGDLGKPISEKPARKHSPAVEQEVDEVFGRMKASASTENVPEDRALAELIEMGFPADTAKIALAETGGEVQGAVGWLLQQAHEESRQKARGDAPRSGRGSAVGSRSPPRRHRGEQDTAGMPAWMREEGRSGSASGRQDSRSPANGDKDAAQVAQEFGSKLFKGANSLWKASQKQMAKTVAEFQQERDASQPKWMQEASANSSRDSGKRRAAAPVDVTDEAAMLGMPKDDRPVRSARSPNQNGETNLAGRSSTNGALPERPASQPRFMPRQATPQEDRMPASKLSRQEVDDQSSQAYISPARRKKATPKPQPLPEPEVDLFSPEPAQAHQPTKTAPQRSTPLSSAPRSSPAPPRPKVPPRSIPAVSASALAISAQHRKAGGEAFKRGDFASAHQSYTSALSPLPETHPITIIVLCNRSLTGLKTGDAKTAVSDADRALTIVGAGQGTGESIDLGPGEGAKDMKEFYGKALMRKAEALEHMEKWTDAASVWRQAVEAGVGGALSLRGRDRCEKAAAPTPAAPVRSVAPAPRKAAPPKTLGNSQQRPTLSSVTSAEAVKKLRAANAAADKADDEKFALTDQVDARLIAWKGGKADNLRALLQSLDGVLWEGAGWKKVGMSDLVMPNKVKIIYMKAIGKVHPDKIPQNATTEQRMISANVFSTLNEAWDKFKKDNNL